MSEIGPRYPPDKAQICTRAGWLVDRALSGGRVQEMCNR